MIIHIENLLKMKKTKLFSILTILVLISLSSCKDEPVVSSAVTVATKDSATISGYVTAELNLQSAGLEAVPAGTSILVSVPYSQLNATATGNWLKTETVGTDGKYSVKIPTNSKGVTVTFTPSAFEYDQTQAYASGATVPKLRLTYNTGSNSLNVVSGQSLNNDIKYTSTTNIAIGVPEVTIAGKVQADLDASIIGLENLPDGTKIIFTATGWADSTTVSSGKYSISVPKGLLINWSINKIISTKVWSPNSLDPSQSTYINVDKTYSISGSSTFNANNLAMDITPSGYTVSVVPLTTTVTGIAKAELDLSISGLEYLPTGSKIYFYTSTWGATATVSSGGSFSVNVPFGTTVNYYIHVTTNQLSQSGISYSHTFQLTGNFSSTTVNDLSLIVPDLLVTTTVTGIAKADLDLSTSGLENLPDGTRITFFTNSAIWKEDAIVKNGSYAINVPSNSTVNYSISVALSQKSATGVTTLNHTFEVNSSFYSPSSSSSYIQNITATAIN
jgi:hypothetical protein